MEAAKGEIVALLVILVVMGAAYSLLTHAPKPVRQFELTAVWATLGLIAAALLSSIDPAISLLLAGLVIAPVWYVTLHMCDQYARTESENTAHLWRHWRATFGNRRNSSSASARTSPASLAIRLDGFGNGQIIEEIEITQIPDDLLQGGLPVPLRNLELAPVEEPMYRRGRIV